MSWSEVLLHVWSYTHLSAAELSQGAALAQAREQHRAAALASAADPQPWKTWAMTEVVYRQHDLLSKLFGISSIGPVALMVFLAGLTSAPCAARRLPAMNLILYFILSVSINVVLKSSIRSLRPAHPAAGMNYTTVHGMPSDHAQFMAGLSVYLLRRWAAAAQQRPPRRAAASSRRAASPPPSSAAASSVALAALLLPATLFVGAGRIYNGYHTVGQVLVGWAVGAALAFLCTSKLGQRVLTRVSEGVLVPVMLVCTFWTDAIC